MLEGLAMEDFGLFYRFLVYLLIYLYGHLLYFMVIWYIFSRFGMF
jgi:hypothetical protein